jgi:Asp-tRNA(Asn)/Glu-tRNA(Gln) amidotransferase A subunit family amidase
MTRTPSTSPLRQYQQKIAGGRLRAPSIAKEVLKLANSNALHNTYLHFDPQALTSQAGTLENSFPRKSFRPALFGIPVSLKDCFDLAGTVTTAGTRFYAEHNGPAPANSAVAERLLGLGCLIPGKTHLHPLAYGITGQNPDFGDCLQPRDPTLLTGGSSSGAAASVQEGSALVAIGTDTGGSIRVPAALCGLGGFRASHSMTDRWPGMWLGGIHLAPSFDTLGFLTRDPRDLEPFAREFFQLPTAVAPRAPRIGTVPSAFLHDATPDVFTAFATFQDCLSEAGAQLTTFNTDWWADAFEILAPIQAHEAAQIHVGHFDRFEPTLSQRLHWGASISPAELATYRARHDAFRTRLNALFSKFDFLILPAAPTHRLLAGADQSTAREQILRYTAPFSLGGNPAVTLPGEFEGAPFGTGLQIAAAPGRDADLLAFVSHLYASR